MQSQKRKERKRSDCITQKNLEEEIKKHKSIVDTKFSEGQEQEFIKTIKFFRELYEKTGDFNYLACAAGGRMNVFEAKCKNKTIPLDAQCEICSKKSDDKFGMLRSLDDELNITYICTKCSAQQFIDAFGENGGFGD